MKKNYEIRLSKGAVKDLKKMEPALRDFMYNRFYEIMEDPYKNEKNLAHSRNSVLSIINLGVWNIGLSTMLTKKAD